MKLLKKWQQVLERRHSACDLTRLGQRPGELWKGKLEYVVSLSRLIHLFDVSGGEHRSLILMLSPQSLQDVAKTRH